MTTMLLEWVFSSVFLILVVLALRAALGRRVSAGLRYGLWAVVLVRLLAPVQLFPSPLAGTWVFSEAQTIHTTINRGEDPLARPEGPSAQTGAAPSGVGGAVLAAPEAPVLPDAPDAPEPPAAPDLTKAPGWLGWVWLAGSAAAASVLLLSNLRFFRRLRRVRIPLDTADCPLRVYTAQGLPSPCLFGIFRPAVYATPEAAADPVMLRHVLAHEYTHYRHGDHIWSLLRCAALAVHWWNPLVWLAVVLSRRDGELACDEGALKRLGDGERAAYGNTLLALVTAKPRPGDLLRFATTMAGDKRSLKERVSRIASAPRRVVWAVVAAVLVTALACLCAFGQGSPELRDDVDDFTPVYTMNGDRNVLIEGVGGVHVEWSRGTNGGGLELSGDMSYFSPKLEGEKAGGGAGWEDAEKGVLHVRLNVDDARIEDDIVYGFGIDFTVDLSNDTFTRKLFTSELGDRTIELTDREMLDMAHILAKLMTEAEDYYRSAQPAPAQTAAPDGTLRADLNRNGVPEELRVVELDGGAGQKLEVWENGRLLYEEEGYFAHAGYNALFLYHDDEGDCLLRYNPYMGQGWCTYSCKLFTLSETGEERAIREDSVEFDINFSSLAHEGFDPEAIAGFMDEVNGLLENSIQLMNTDADLLAAFEEEGRLYDSLVWLDRWEPVFTRDGSKSLLENLRAFQAAMEQEADSSPAGVYKRYLAVVQGEEPLYSPEHGRRMTLDELCAETGPGYARAGISDFTVLDLDGDGAQEMILRMGTYHDWCVVLHGQDGEVRAYALYIRWLNTLTLKEDGAFWWSSSGFENGWGKLRFTADGYETENTIWHMDTTYYLGGEAVPQEEYDAANERQEAAPDAVWHAFSEENIFAAFFSG